jgi:hypothetical protein
MSVKVIPISREYREGYEGIRWDVPKREDVPVKECVKVYPPVGWVAK